MWLRSVRTHARSKNVDFSGLSSSTIYWTPNNNNTGWLSWWVLWCGDEHQEASEGFGRLLFPPCRHDRGRGLVWGPGGRVLAWSTVYSQQQSYILVVSICPISQCMRSLDRTMTVYVHSCWRWAVRYRYEFVDTIVAYRINFYTIVYFTRSLGIRDIHGMAIVSYESYSYTYVCICPQNQEVLRFVLFWTRWQDVFCFLLYPWV